MRWSPGRDDGQNTVEHTGLALLVAAVVVVALGAAPALSVLAGDFGQAVCRVAVAVGGGDCAGSLPPEARPNEYYRPESCLVSASASRYGATAAIAVVTAGKEVSFLTQRMSDGTVRVTAVDADSAGLEAGIGGGVNLGSVVRLGAEANVGGEVTIRYGDTWVFRSPEEAERFIGDVKTQAAIDVAEDVPFVGDAVRIYDAFAGPDLPSPTVTRTTVSGQLGADAGAGLGLGKVTKNSAGERDDGSWQAGPNADANVALAGEGRIVIEHDHRERTVSKIYELGGGGSAGAQVPTQAVDAAGQRSGAMKIVRREDGTLVGIQFVQTTVAGGEATIITTDLAIRDETQREIAERWLASQHDAGTTLRLTWDDMAPTEEPDPGADGFAHLLYEEAQVTRASYNSVTNPVAFGAEAKLGLQLGLNVYHEDASQDLASAQYLGAPRAGNRSYVTYRECHR